MNRHFLRLLPCLIAACVNAAAIVCRDPSPPSLSSPAMNEPTLSPAPGMPTWLRSAVIDDNSRGGHEMLQEARERIVRTYDPRRYHVFWGLIPEDDAQAPAGWIDARRKELAEQQSKWLSPDEIEAMLKEVTFPYHPYRLFVAPREDTAEVIRTFRVGSHAEDDDAYLNAVVAKVLAIDKITAVTIHELSPAHVRLVFLDAVSMETARELGSLFPFMTDESGLLGMEGYLSELEADSGDDFLAEQFFRDQEITLWWD